MRFHCCQKINKIAWESRRFNFSWKPPKLPTFLSFLPQIFNVGLWHSFFLNLTSDKLNPAPWEKVRVRNGMKSHRTQGQVSHKVMKTRRIKAQKRKVAAPRAAWRLETVWWVQNVAGAFRSPLVLHSVGHVSACGRVSLRNSHQLIAFIDADTSQTEACFHMLGSDFFFNLCFSVLIQ